MHLVRIDSQLENDFLLSLGASSGVFELNGFAQIGANDRAVAGEWRWIDGELFWGHDATPMFEAWLDDPGLFRRGGHERLATLPVGVQRLR